MKNINFFGMNEDNTTGKSPIMGKLGERTARQAWEKNVSDILKDEFNTTSWSNPVCYRAIQYSNFPLNELSEAERKELTDYYAAKLNNSKVYKSALKGHSYKTVTPFTYVKTGKYVFVVAKPNMSMTKYTQNGGPGIIMFTDSDMFETLLTSTQLEIKPAARRFKATLTVLINGGLYFLSFHKLVLMMHNSYNANCDSHHINNIRDNRACALASLPRSVHCNIHIIERAKGHMFDDDKYLTYIYPPEVAAVVEKNLILLITILPFFKAIEFSDDFDITQDLGQYSFKQILDMITLY